MSKTVTFIIEKRNQSIVTSEIRTEYFVEDRYSLNAVTSSNLSVKYEIISGVGEINRNQLVFKQASNLQLKISQAGNEEYNSAEQVVTFNISKKKQEINVKPLQSAYFVNDKAAIIAQSSSGLPLTCSVNKNFVDVNANVICFKKAGELTLTIVQPGNHEYSKAEKVFNILIEKRSQQITCDITDKDFLVGQTIELKAEASSKLPVRYEIVSGYADLTDWGNLSFTQAGKLDLRIYQDGNDEFYNCEKTLRLKVNVTTSTQKQDVQLSRVYPNPVHDILHIQFQVSGTHKITLANLHGKICIDKVIEDSATEISFTQLPVGLYLLFVESDGKTSVHKIIKK